MKISGIIYLLGGEMTDSDCFSIKTPHDKDTSQTDIFDKK